MRARDILTLAAAPGVETVEPTTERAALAVVYVFSDLEHVDMVTFSLP